MIVFENYASEYSPDILRDNVPAGVAEKSSILLHDFLTTGRPTLSNSTVKTWLQDFTKAGLGSANILDYGYAVQDDKNETPADLGSVAKILA